MHHASQSGVGQNVNAPCVAQTVIEQYYHVGSIHFDSRMTSAGNLAQSK